MLSTFWRVEVALTTAPYATSQTYTDISSQVRALSVESKRGGPFESVKAGRASVRVDNRDGRWNASSTYASAPYAGNIVPDRRVRLSVRESDAASWVTLATLYLERVDTADGPHDSTATLECSGLFRLFAQSQPVVVSRPVELPGQRVTALLSAAGVPANRTGTIDNGTVMLEAADLSGQVLALVHEVNRAEWGYLRETPNGEIEFRDRYHWADVAALKTSQATVDEAEFLYDNVPSTSGAFLTPRSVAASGASGDVHAYTSVNAPANFPETFHQELGVLLLFDGDVEVLAEHVQKIAETVDIDEARPSGVRMWVATPTATNSGALPEIVDSGALGAFQLLNYVSVTYRPLGWSSDRDAQCRLESVRHDVTPEAWFVELGFSAVDNVWTAQIDNHFTEFGGTLSNDDRGAI